MSRTNRTPHSRRRKWKKYDDGYHRGGLDAKRRESERVALDEIELDIQIADSAPHEVEVEHEQENQRARQGSHGAS